MNIVLCADPKYTKKLKANNERKTIMENILKQAINFYGPDMQLNVCIEELSELIKELCKYKRGQENFTDIAEEMADVAIILKELVIMFDNSELVKAFIDMKLNRLKERMEG
jgi:NTP pyrophosphatase (non-canonical NTP hydrolase)